MASRDSILYFDAYRPQDPELLPSEVERRLMSSKEQNAQGGTVYLPISEEELNNDDRYKKNLDSLRVFHSNPLQYTMLYNIAEDIEKNGEKEKQEDKDKKTLKTEVTSVSGMPPFLGVELPSGVRIKIRSDGVNGGKIELECNINELTLEQMLELDNFLSSNGMHGIDFGSTSDRLRHAFKKRIYAAQIKDALSTSPEDNSYEPTDMSKVNVDQSLANQKIEEKLLAGFNKKYGKNYTVHSSRGVRTYKIYKGKRKDKNGNIRAPSFLIETSIAKIRGVPVLCIGYATKDGEKIGVQEAETVVEAAKECDYKFIDVGGIPNDDERPFIAVKAHREGLIPVNTTLNAKHYFEGLEAASNKIAEDPVEKYHVGDWKLNAAKQMERNKGTARNAALIDMIRGSEYFYRFSDQRFDGEYTRDINRENMSGNGPRIAASAIAATYVVDELFYGDKIDTKIKDKEHEDDIQGFFEREKLAWQEFQEEFHNNDTILSKMETQAEKDAFTKKNEAKLKKAEHHFNEVNKILNKTLKEKGPNAKSRDIDFDDMFQIYKHVKERKVLEIERRYEMAFEGPGGPQEANAILGRYNATGTRGLSAASTRVEKKFRIGLRRVDAYSGEYKGDMKGKLKARKYADSSSKTTDSSGYDDYGMYEQADSATTNLINELQTGYDEKNKENAELQEQIRRLKDEKVNAENRAASAESSRNLYKKKYEKTK